MQVVAIAGPPRAVHRGLDPPYRHGGAICLPPLAKATGGAYIWDVMTPSLSGQLLLAMPGIGDPRFERAVIAICVHDENGALGLTVSHLAEGLAVRDIMAQLDIDPGLTPDDVPVFLGGPVEPSRGFVLHSCDYEGEGTYLVGNRWGLSASLGVLRDIAAGRGPKRWLMALGYAGWGEGQLDQELTRHGWMSLENGEPDSIIFETPADQRWPRAFAQLGVDVTNLSAVAGRA
jgi:putative transcriptional regulator